MSVWVSDAHGGSSAEASQGQKGAWLWRQQRQSQAPLEERRAQAKAKERAHRTAWDVNTEAERRMSKQRQTLQKVCAGATPASQPCKPRAEVQAFLRVKECC